MKKLTEICNIQYGYAFDSGCFTEKCSYPPLIRIRDVKRGFSETYYSGEYSKEYVVHAGDLLIGMDGEFNIARWKSVDGLLNQRVCKLTAKEGTDKEYLRFALVKALKIIENKTAFVTVKHLSAKELNKLELDLPCIEKQSLRAKILTKLERIIWHRENELRELDNFIRARFVEMFGNIKENRFVKCKMREVAHIKHGYAYSGEYFSDKDNGVVLVTPGNFALGGGFQEIKNKYFTSKYPEEYVLHPGDLIVTMTDLSKKADTLGYGAIIPDNTSKIYLHNQRIGLFDELDKRLNPVFVRWFMQTDEYRLEIVRTSTGSTVHHTSPDRILDSLIFLPPIQLQNDFVKFANQVDKSKVKVQKALDETQKLFDSLMQQYFG